MGKASKHGRSRAKASGIFKNAAKESGTLISHKCLPITPLHEQLHLVYKHLSIGKLFANAVWSTAAKPLYFIEAFVNFMPTIKQFGPYQFIFFSSDHNEPPHIHIKRENKRAKFWLEPIEMAYNRRFAMHELNRIRQLIHQNKALFLEAWNVYFTTQS